MNSRLIIAVALLAALALLALIGLQRALEEAADRPAEQAPPAIEGQQVEKAATGRSSRGASAPATPTASGPALRARIPA